jgi:hypothetical protein
MDNDFGELNEDLNEIEGLEGKAGGDARSAGTALFLAVASGALDPSDALFLFATLNQINGQVNQAHALANSATANFAQQSPGGGEPSLMEVEHQGENENPEPAEPPEHPDQMDHSSHS